MADNGRQKAGRASGQRGAEQGGRPLNGARAVVAALESEGVGCIFGYPGGTVLELYDALFDSDIEHILVRHEQAAVHAADGYARTTGKPGVVLVTSGPGATNTVTGIANAYMDSIPLVVIVGQVPTYAIGTDAFQEADFFGISMPVVKHSYLITDVDDLVPSVHEAFHIASTGRRGPVVICVPSDIAAMPASYSARPEKVAIPSYKPTYKGNARQVKQAAELVRQATRPVIVAGGGVIAANAMDDLKSFAELLQIPVAQTLMGRGCFPAGHHLHLGLMGRHGFPVANLAVSGSDLIIGVGTRFSNRSTCTAKSFAPGVKVIHIDIDPAEIGKNVHVDVPIVGDAHEVLSALFKQVQASDPEPATGMWLDQIDDWRARVRIAEPERDPSIINAEDVFDALNAHCAQRDAIFVTEVGEHQMWAARFLAERGPRSFVTSGGAGTMGFGFPAAMGVQLAHPDKLVVCLAGDGSIQMNIQEMATCAEHGLPVKVVVFDNASLGMVRQLQDLYFKQRHSAVNLPRIPDYPLLAQAYGWQGWMVDDPCEVDAAIERLLDCEGPAILDVRMSQVEQALPMVGWHQQLGSMIGVEPVEDADGRR